MTSHDTSYESFKNKGNEAYKAKSYTEAIKCYTNAINSNSNEPIAYSNRAICYLHQGRYFEAKQDCDKAIELDPTAVKAFYRRATALRELHRYHESLKDLKMVSELDPNLSHVRNEIDNIEKLLKLDSRIDLKPIEKPDQYRSGKPIKTFELMNKYTGSKLYN